MLSCFFGDHVPYLRVLASRKDVQGTVYLWAEGASLTCWVLSCTYVLFKLEFKLEFTTSHCFAGFVTSPVLSIWILCWIPFSFQKFTAHCWSQGVLPSFWLLNFVSENSVGSSCTQSSLILNRHMTPFPEAKRGTTFVRKRCPPTCCQSVMLMITHSWMGIYQRLSSHFLVWNKGAPSPPAVFHLLERHWQCDWWGTGCENEIHAVCWWPFPPFQWTRGFADHAKQAESLRWKEVYHCQHTEVRGVVLQLKRKACPLCTLKVKCSLTQTHSNIWAWCATSRSIQIPRLTQHVAHSQQARSESKSLLHA